MADPFSSLGFVEEKPAVAAAGGFDALGFQPDTAGASQAEVRAADTSAAPLSPMAAFAVREQAFENAMKRFKKQCEKAGILSEIRKREHYEKPSVKRKKKALAAKKRALKKMRKGF